ncbi:M1 family metallopeptidase [Capnocytophaga canis]|uniref:M1 family metallopeptidase n=1 Tax=Capnocytophaga canis TaxID=1848903 RepID=UPI0037D21102
MKKYGLIALLPFFFAYLNAQNTTYWQQKVHYEMEIDVDAKNFQYKGKQKLTYFNNSPDTLQVVFYHLYLNAFQPNSEMDFRLQSIADPDRRMVKNLGTAENPVYESRIAKLKPNEIGYINVKSLKQDGTAVEHTTEGTILKVKLNKPIPPKSKGVFTMEFDAQVPVMIRRTGRNNPDGVALSMAQWYPKIVAYDYRGWHPTEYIGREFYGVFGDFDVKITIDKNYVLGGSGTLINADEIGFGYEKQGVILPKTKGRTKTWHFVASNVHDFTWAADPQFKHDKITLNDGKIFHFLYKTEVENWKKIQPKLIETFELFNNLVGKYPWERYSFIQGGDGGMEYAMCTLLVGGANYDDLLGTAVHELAHAWFQHAINTDEGSYAWMDEGFTSFIEDLAMALVINPTKNETNPFEGSYKRYFRLIKSGWEEPATTHADRFQRNFAYSVMAYSKGTLFLTQLGYIIGEQNLIKTLQQFYKEYALKSPHPNDFVRVAEKVSGMQLGWFLNEFISTTHTVDYAIESVKAKGKKTEITLRRIGALPLPVDLFVVDKSKKVTYCYIPLRMQFGEKSNPYQYERKVFPAWGWATPTYTFEIDVPFEELHGVEIDPSEMTIDINRQNNSFTNQ